MGQDWPWVDGGYMEFIILLGLVLCANIFITKSIFKTPSVPIFMMKLIDLNSKFANKKTGSF